VNTGAIYHYVTKPWDPAQLENTMRHALQLFTVQRERDHLLREKMSVLHNMMVSDRVVSLGYMAAGMSHHIRNSLVPVKTFIDLVPQHLREENIDPATSKNPEFWNDYQRSAQVHLDKINSLLKELWAVAETPGLAFTDRVHLRDVITEVTVRSRDALATRGLEVEIDIPEVLPILSVDKPKFQRIFDLLIRDEIVSLPEGSRLTISAALVEGAAAERIRVIVRDNGPGLPEETLRTIFDPFNARSDSPSEHGINLMACYFVVHYHGGQIEARSAPGQGTEFCLEFPVSPNAPAVSGENREFFQKLRANDEIWQKLLSTR
jgi:two-component system probable response regulator PhcQ